MQVPVRPRPALLQIQEWEEREGRAGAGQRCMQPLSEGVVSDFAALWAQSTRCQ